MVLDKSLRVFCESERELQSKPNTKLDDLQRGMSMNQKDYNQSLYLPQTDFPMKAKLKEREPEIIQQWMKRKIYHKMLEGRKGRPLFFLPDGPPYANGPIHIGHVLNKILKDIVVKHKSMKGFYSPFLPSWDCHGLPIELKALEKHKKELAPSLSAGRAEGASSTKPRPDSSLEGKALRELCREEALAWVKEQEKSFQRLGVFADWGKRVLTMDPDYEAEELRLFARLVEKGLIYRGRTPVFWCFKLKTALADSEAEYRERKDPSIYVKFALDEKSQNKLGLSKPVCAVIWTTTPWTLPANSAIALNPDLQYGLYEGEREFYILAEARAEKFFQETGLGPWPQVSSRKGRELAVAEGFDPQNLDQFHQDREKGLLAHHPFMKSDGPLGRLCPLIQSLHVTLEAGAGLVHIAPGHGPEDFLLGLRYGLNKPCPVDERGHFYHSKDLPQWLRACFILKANKIIAEKLKESGHLLREGALTHSCPYNPRAGSPLIYRLTPQWFLSLDHPISGKAEGGIRDQALLACETAPEKGGIHFVPAWGKARLKAMIQNAPDWCLSRQRMWGVPLPVFYCRNPKCRASLPPPLEPSKKASANSLASQEDSAEIIKALADKMESSKEGINYWFSRKAGELLPKGLKCLTCGGAEFEKGGDILDVWFDSGAQSFVLAKKILQGPAGQWKADLFLEGSDQHRGWFQTSLKTSLALNGRPPFKTLFTHGFVMDKQGRKMSKSRGNVLAPEKLIETGGAEILRLWAAGENMSSDVNASEESFQRLKEIYRRYRNSFRFMLGNLKGFRPSKDLKSFEKLTPADRWVLARLNHLLEEGGRDLESLSFHKLCQQLNRFFTVDLSSFYLDIIKDRLYTFPEKSPERLAGQSALYHLLKSLLPFMAPVTSFLSEEAYSYLPGERKESVFLEDFPAPRPKWRDEGVLDLFAKMFPLREQINKELEDLRRRKLIGSPLQALAKITIKKDFISPAMSERQRLEFFSVSKLEIQEGPKFQLKVEKAPGEKCPRCWFVTESLKPEGLCPKCEQNLKEAPSLV